MKTAEDQPPSIKTAGPELDFAIEASSLATEPYSLTPREQGTPSRRCLGEVTAVSKSSASLTHRRTQIRALSDRLSSAVRCIRLLEAVRWDASIERDFFARGCRELPNVTRDYYTQHNSGFEPHQKLRELADLEIDVSRSLGNHPAGKLLVNRCRQYQDAVRLIAARGTAEFHPLSVRIFGSGTSVRRNANEVRGAIAFFDRWLNQASEASDRDIYEAEDAANQLHGRLCDYFQGPLAQVKLSECMLADAAAGCDYLKLRSGARFSPIDIGLLEVHEGWVHLGTTFNGRQQSVLPCLAKAPPGVTRTQEGLAVLMEFLAGVTHQQRVARLVHRLRGVVLAESGADFLQVFRFFVEEGCGQSEAYHQTARIFRGSLPSGAGPFTKDLGYGIGLVTVTRALRTLTATHQGEELAVLFCGKVTVEEMPLLLELRAADLLQGPRFLPDFFRDPVGLREMLPEIG